MDRNSPRRPRRRCYHRGDEDLRCRGFANRPFAVLSGGEQARVALARVLAQETSTILLDEPTAALDLGHQEAVMSVARARAADGDAVVVVLHDLALAAAYADRIVVLENGRIAADGPRNRCCTKSF